MKATFVRLAALPALVAAALVAGCGSSGSGVPTLANSTSAQQGNLQLNVQFPTAPSRASSRQQGVPVGAAVVKIQVVDPANGNPLTQAQIVGVGATGASATIQGIRVGAARVIVTAHPDQNAAQPALASGQADVTVQAGATTPVTITLTTNVAQVTVAPAAVTLTLGTPLPTATLTATVLDANSTHLTGAVLFWSSSNTTVATVQQSSTDPTMATVTGVGPGTAVIEVRDFNSGKVADATVTVQSPAR